MPLPIALDHQSMRQDLLRWGWNDYKIEAAIGSAVGYMAKLRNGQMMQMSYGMGARFYNLWEDEAMRRLNIPKCEPGSYAAHIHSFAATLATA